MLSAAGLADVRRRLHRGAVRRRDKKVKNARVTIKHNGVTIFDDFELPQLTPGGAPTGVSPARARSICRPTAIR